MRKILLTMLFLIFLINFVNAATWDNSLGYRPGGNGNPDLKVEIKNWFGWGENYGTAEIKSHSKPDEIIKVPRGSNVPVMYYDFNFDYLVGFGV